MKEFKEWDGFEGKIWKEEINTRDFIQKNYTPYDGDESFLAGPTDATNQLWGELQKLQKEERANNGVLDMETEVVSSLTAYGPGYIKEELKDLEKIVGLQTDKPLKRAFMPYGGIKMAEQACTTYGYTPNPKFNKIFNELPLICNDNSLKERRADEIERIVNRYKIAELMESHIGEDFDAIITYVSPKGITIRTTNYVTGRIGIGELMNNGFKFSPEKNIMINKSSGKVYKFGDNICVTVKNVNKINYSIDFSLAKSKVKTLKKI